MFLCRFCGSQVPDGAAFCGTCGQPVSSSATLTERISSLGETTLPAETRLLPPSQQVEPVTRPEESERRRFTPFLPTPYPPLAGQMPAQAGTPQISHIPTLPGTPQTNSAPTVQGTPTQSPPGSISSFQSGTYHTTQQFPHRANTPHNMSSPNSPAGSASSGQPSSHVSTNAGRQVLRPSRHLRSLRHGVHGVSHSASTAGTAVATKVIVTVVIIAVIATGTAIAAPRILRPAAQQMHGQAKVKIQTQPMPATLTSCPAPGTARAMVSRPLALGQDDSLVYVENDQSASLLKRYDTKTGQTSRIYRAANTAIADAQITSDGQWVLFDTSAIAGGSTPYAVLSKMQMVRLDGQGLQTLYCFSSSHVSNDPSVPSTSSGRVTMSPDQRYIAFEENNAATYILNSRTGQLMKEVPPLQKDQYSFTYFPPLGWMDETHLYLTGVDEAIVDGGIASGLYLLNVSQGPLASAQSLPVAIKGAAMTSFAWDFDENPARTSLYYSQYPSDQGGIEAGTSFITRQLPMGGQASTIYHTTLNTITAVRALGNSSLLFFLDTGRTSNDLTVQTGKANVGWWKINADGSGLMRLNINTGSPNSFTHSPWASISRDSRFYLDYLINPSPVHFQTQVSLQIASIVGGAPTPIASSDFPNSSPPQGWPVGIIPAGWTTM